MAQESKSVLQADLNLSRSTVEQQWEQIEEQSKELENLRYQQGQMKSKIKVGWFVVNELVPYYIL